MDRFTISNVFFCDSPTPNSAAYEKPPGTNPAAFRVWQRHLGHYLSERMTRERWNEQLPPRRTPAVRLSWSQDTRTSAEAQALLSILTDNCIVMSNNFTDQHGPKPPLPGEVARRSRDGEVAASLIQPLSQPPADSSLPLLSLRDISP